jgi:collagenase-like PrtC family protease
MAILEFSVPCPNDLESLNELFKLNKSETNKIREIYLAGPECYSGAGRIMSETVTMNGFMELVELIHKAGIKVNLVLNTTCEGSSWYSSEVIQSTMAYLGQVYETHGIEAVTIANPIYIWEVRKKFPNLEICASVLGDIDCVQRALIYSQAGANVITPDVNINRNLELLKKIKDATKAELRLLVNEGCLYKCPFRRFHFNYISHKSREPSMLAGENIFTSKCLQIYNRDHAQILKSCWIRPEDIGKYEGISSYFKIAGRASPTNQGVAILRYTRAYMRQSWNGNLVDIMDSSIYRFGQHTNACLDNKTLSRSNFFEKTSSCNYDCTTCNYCDELAKKLINARLIV